MFSAIDAVMDKVERQLRDHKTKNKRHKVSSQEATESSENEAPFPEIVYDDRMRQNVIKKKIIFAKPMTLDEAVMQLELSDNSFLVFTDASSRLINVLYRRKDGQYGLIEPHS